MMFRKKPIVIEAVQWLGDKLYDWTMVESLGDVLGEQDRKCSECGLPMTRHGWVKTLEGRNIVHIACPGDWIIRSPEGEIFTLKPALFERTYEPCVEQYE